MDFSLPRGLQPAPWTSAWHWPEAAARVQHQDALCPLLSEVLSGKGVVFQLGRQSHTLQ
jgi:hypothetical protein